MKKQDQGGGEERKGKEADREEKNKWRVRGKKKKQSTLTSLL